MEYYRKKYNEVLERLKSLIKNDTDHIIYEDDILERVPELRESEDERMIQYFKDLAPFDKADELYEKYGFSHKGAIAWLEKQGEQPRYSIGDVLCDKSCTTLDKDAQPNFEIVDIRNGMYICDKCSFPISQQNEYELVTKKIEQKPAWSEVDELHIRELESLVKQEWAKAERENDRDKIHKMSDLSFFLKTLKPQLKQEWSEEDERIKNNLLSELTNLSVRKLIEKETEKKYASWLKSLRPQKRWKPSEEMLEALYRAIPENVMEISEDEMLLDKLYQGLKYGRVLSKK